jgi:hypothetical protein
VRKRATLIRRTEFSNLLNPIEANDLLWPVSEKGYNISAELIYPKEDGVRLTFPLSNPDLFLSFARLGAQGEPSNGTILRWVNEHGLLKREDQYWQEEPETWGQYVREEDRVLQAPMKLKDFKTEVRCARQLLTLYADLRARNLQAIASRFTTPPTGPHYSAETIVDRYLRCLWEHSYAYGEELAKRVQAGTQQPLPPESYLGLAIEVLRRSVKHTVRNIRPAPEPNYWDQLPANASITFSGWWHCTDMLSAIYLQFYLLIIDNKPMRTCKNPNCLTPFPATPKNKIYCKDGCRSTGRNYRD